MTTSTTMNPIAGLLSTDDILFDEGASTKRELFEVLGRFLAKRHGLSRLQVVDSLCARERLGSTGLGNGVAIPHARIAGLVRPVAVIVRTRLAIAFDAPDGKPVRDLVVLLVPERANEEHLELLASVAGLLGDREFRARLRNCATPRELALLYAGHPDHA